MTITITTTTTTTLIKEKKYDKASISILDRGQMIGLIKIMFGVGVSRGKLNTVCPRIESSRSDQ